MFETTAPSKTWQKTKEYSICAFMGFASGLPLFILVNLLPIWLKEYGISIKTIGLISMVMMPYAWKFLWAPFVDSIVLPFLTRRRAWIALTQVLLLVFIILMGQLNPQNNMQMIIVLSILIAFVSATHDIVIDAYRREFFTDEQQSSMMAVFMNTYKLAGLIPGSLSLILADQGMPWGTVWTITGAFMLIGLITTLLSPEPEHKYQPPTLEQGLYLPFKEFFTRFNYKHAVLILSFICFYKLGDTMATSLASIFYLEMGYSKTDIGVIAKQAGLWSSIAGGILGAIWMSRLGIFKSLWIFGVLQFAAIFGFLWLAMPSAPKTLWALAIVIGVEAFTVGLASAAIGGYLASITSRQYSATQFALFSSLAALPRTLIAGSTGFLQVAFGWQNFFILCLFLAIPGMTLLYFLHIQHRNFLKSSAVSLNQ